MGDVRPSDGASLLALPFGGSLVAVDIEQFTHSVSGRMTFFKLRTLKSFFQNNLVPDPPFGVVELPL
jgi:hypothetical protein